MLQNSSNPDTHTEKTDTGIASLVDAVEQSALKPKKHPLSLWKRLGYAVGIPLWVFFGFMLAQAIIVVAVQGLLALGVRFDGVNEAVFNVITNAIIYSVAIAIVVGVPYVLKRRTTLKEMGLHRGPKWLEFLAAPAGAVVYFILSGIIISIAASFMPFIDLNQTQETGFTGVTASFDIAMAFIGIVICAPVAEELLFRGYLLGKLRKYVSTWVAVLLTSILFGILHFQWNVSLDTFALSLILCVLRISTGSLWPSILLHMLKNGLAFYLLFINPTFLSTLGG